jgi:hypothetical protein
MASIGKRGDKRHVRICRKDHPTICKSFSLLRDAQTWAKNTELRLERGEALGRETVLLLTLLQRYLTSVSPLKKGHKQEVSASIPGSTDQNFVFKSVQRIQADQSSISAAVECLENPWRFNWTAHTHDVVSRFFATLLGLSPWDIACPRQQMLTICSICRTLMLVSLNTV